jgi:hypothetical protein
MKLKILAIFLLYFAQTATSQYTAKVIDSQLREINTKLQNEEAKIESLMGDLVEFIILLNSSLATSSNQNKAQIMNFRGSLTNLVELLNDLKTLDNYWPYANITTCSDANRKVTDIDFDIRQYRELIWKVAQNITQLASHHRWTVYYYGLAFFSLGFGSEQQRRSATVLTTTNSIIVEYYNYIALLTRSTVNETIINTHLTLFMKKFCDCSSNLPSTSAANLSTFENNVLYIEKPLVELQTTVLSAATDALSKSKAAAASLVGSSSPLLIGAVDRTTAFLANLVTMSDYRNITWNTVYACTDLHLRLGHTWFKYFQYLQTFIACSRNTTWTHAHHYGLNATAVDKKLNNKQLLAVRNLIGSMKTLGPLMNNYTSQLGYSVVKMFRTWADLRIFGDSFCGCRDKNSPASVTTSKLGHFLLLA